MRLIDRAGQRARTPSRVHGENMKRKDNRIKLRNRITGETVLVDVHRARQLQREQLPAHLGVGGVWEQLHNHKRWEPHDDRARS
jgi:hypothetical protein